MTIGGWIIFVMFAVFIGIGGMGVYSTVTTKPSEILTIVITVILIIALLFGMLWFFNNTAIGKRALVDQKSSMGNGLERTITIYTADGEVIATYTGMIDIETNDGGYVKFDFEGKRYIYYNCFVESIAEIG